MKTLLVLSLFVVFAPAAGAGDESLGSSSAIGYYGFGTGGAVQDEFTIVNNDVGSLPLRRVQPLPPRWKLTNTDPSMYALATKLRVGRGGRDCGTGMWMYRYGFRSDGKPLVAGGDRLARYLIDQYERALKAGALNAGTFLYYAAYTESDAIVEYLADMIDKATLEDDAPTLLQLMRVAAVSARPEVVDDLLFALESWTDTSDRKHVEVRTGAVHALRGVIDYTEVDRPEVLSLVREIEWNDAEHVETRKTAWYALNRWEVYQLTDRRTEYPTEFGERPQYRRRSVEQSRQREAYLLQRNPEAIGPDGCVREFMHCGLAEWAIKD